MHRAVHFTKSSSHGRISPSDHGGGENFALRIVTSFPTGQREPCDPSSTSGTLANIRSSLQTSSSGRNVRSAVMSTPRQILTVSAALGLFLIVTGGTAHRLWGGAHAGSFGFASAQTTTFTGTKITNAGASPTSIKTANCAHGPPIWRPQCNGSMRATCTTLCA
jgi:hypothetical protein